MKTIGKKLELSQFVKQILENYGVKGIKEINGEVFAQCPYHWPEKNFSCFSVSITKESDGYPFYCFSCKNEGNIYELISHIMKCDYKKAIKIFAKKVGFKPINLESIKQHFNNLKSKLMEKNEVKIKMPERSTTDKIFEYFNERNELQAHGLLRSKYIISKYDLYFCDSGQFANRIIMPIRDVDGKYIYFQNRAVYDYMSKNKFIKGSNATDYLYGLFEILKRKKVIIVEGPFDLYQLISFMIKNDIFDYDVVSTMGTNITEYRASLISEFFDEAYILFDNDLAGLSGERMGFRILNDYVKTFKLTQNLWPGKDPGNSTEEQLKRVFKKQKQKVTVNVRWPLF